MPDLYQKGWTKPGFSSNPKYCFVFHLQLYTGNNVTYALSLTLLGYYTYDPKILELSPGYSSLDKSR